jgi:hypothetical protein
VAVPIQNTLNDTGLSDHATLARTARAAWTSCALLCANPVWQIHGILEAHTGVVTPTERVGHQGPGPIVHATRQPRADGPCRIERVVDLLRQRSGLPGQVIGFSWVELDADPLNVRQKTGGEQEAHLDRSPKPDIDAYACVQHDLHHAFAASGLGEQGFRPVLRDKTMLAVCPCHLRQRRGVSTNHNHASDRHNHRRGYSQAPQTDGLQEAPVGHPPAP